MASGIYHRVKNLYKNQSIKKILRFIEACKYLDRNVWDNKGGNKCIYDALDSGNPQAIGKLGSSELQALRNYLRYRHQDDWQSKVQIYQKVLYTNSGVYPEDPIIFRQYCEYMLEEILPEISVMAVWFNLQEAKIVKQYSPNASLIPIQSLESYLTTQDRWTSILRDKTVLVMHPFEKSIRKQYGNRLSVWYKQGDILPKFNLVQIKVPHYPALVPPTHLDWFSSLKEMENQMAEIDFDIALIGAGAYSLPLAVYAKKIGKQGIHLGGATQIYFGLKGGRWDDDQKIASLYNDSWIRPLPEDTPKKSDLIEGGCYW